MLTLSFGQLPMDNVILSAVHEDGYSMCLNQSDYAIIKEAINQSIDSHLQAVFFKQNKNEFVFEQKSMPVLLRRLTEIWINGNEPAGDLASSILDTLNVEWI